MATSAAEEFRSPPGTDAGRGYAVNAAMTEHSIKAVGTRATHERFKEAASRYGKEAGEMTVCKVIEDDAGIELRVAGDWTPPWEAKAPGS